VKKERARARRLANAYAQAGSKKNAVVPGQPRSRRQQAPDGYSQAEELGALETIREPSEGYPNHGVQESESSS
jgi:hypothetical protein